MQAKVGDELTVKGRHQGDEDRHGQIIEVHGEGGQPPQTGPKVPSQAGQRSLPVAIA